MGKKHFGKLIVSVLLVIVMIAALAACSMPEGTPSASGSADAQASESVQPSEDAQASESAPDSSGEVAPGSGKGMKIGLLNYAESFESSQLIIEGVKKAAEKYGVEMVYADINMDPQKVPQSIDNFVIQDVDGIIDASWFADVGVTTVDTCKKNDIPLITCDIPYPGDYSYQVGADSNDAGVVAGDYMTKYVNDNWDGAIDYFVCFFPESAGPDVKLRQSAAIDTMKANGIDIPDDKVVWLDNGGDTLKAKTMAQDFLTAHPDAKHIIIAPNNVPGAVGALAAVEAANRSEDCIIYSYGDEQSAIDNLKQKDNCWIGTVSFGLGQYGDIGISTIIRLKNGETDIPHTLKTDLYMIDRSNVDDVS